MAGLMRDSLRYLISKALLTGLAGLLKISRRSQSYLFQRVFFSWSDFENTLSNVDRVGHCNEARCYKDPLDRNLHLTAFLATAI